MLEINKIYNIGGERYRRIKNLYQYIGVFA